MNEIEKIKAAEAALSYVKYQQVIGIGTGSTVKPFIELLNKRIEKENLNITVIPTSIESQKLLHKRIKIGDLSLNEEIDITIDGADKASEDFFLIKGGGGALLREKYVALNSKLNITIIDETKISSPLNNHPLPVEISQFGYLATTKRLSNNNFYGNLRIKNGTPFITDNGNYIYDIDIKCPIEDPRKMHNSIKSISGVIETGLFLQTSQIIIIGKKDSDVDIWSKR